MRPSLVWVAAFSLGFVAASPATAGPNAGGVIILHAEPLVGRENPPLCDTFALTRCEDAVTQAPTGGGDTNVWRWYAVGAFPADASPRLKGVTFGIDYSAGVFVGQWQSCGDFELTTPNWPSASGEGTSVTWNEARTERLVPIYGFAGYSYYADPAHFCVGPHPTQGGYFGDDSTPALLDPIVDFGCLGFGTEGYLPCPTGGPILGACCLQGGECLVVSEADCQGAGGSWLGPDAPSCDPNPCAVPAQRTSWGTVKGRYQSR